MFLKKGIFQYRNLGAEKILAIGFALMILLGTFILHLPICSTTGESIGWLPALFTATSATCVTGLSMLDIAKSFSLFGKICILVLVQIGGIGFMMFGTFIMIILGRRISLKNRLLIRDAFNTNSLSGIVRLYRTGFTYTILIECIGACVLAFRFVPMFGWLKGAWYSIFHSISAFCNAGFDLFGNNQSLMQFSSDALVLLTISLLIIFGGIGFIVMDDVLQKKFRLRRFSLHTKIVLLMSAILIVIGTLLLMLTEYNNQGIWVNANAGFAEKTLNLFFQSVSLRTAGFTSIELEEVSNAGKIMSSIWMFTGASPASTGGGIKTTTMFLLLLQTWHEIRGEQELSVFSKQISRKQSARALATILVSFSILIFSSWLISFFEFHTNISFIDIFYNTTSAIGTVGLSSFNIQNLSNASNIVLIFVMFFGRVGPLTIAFAMGNRAQNSSTKIQYPEERILIG